MDKLTWSEKIVAGILCAIFTISFICVMAGLYRAWTHFAKFDLHLCDDTVVVIFVSFIVLLVGLQLVFQIYQVEKAGLNWRDFDNLMVFKVKHTLVGFLMLAGLDASIFHKQFGFSVFIGAGIIEFALIIQGLFAYVDFRTTRSKRYLVFAIITFVAVCAIILAGAMCPS
jgi:hypothetical protein